MPITSDYSGGKNYTLGRGEVFFNRFSAAVLAAGLTAASKGEGERYLGNTPDFSMSASEEKLDHFDSDHGIRTKDDSVTLQLDRTGTIGCDNVIGPNLGLYFLSAAGETTLTQTSGTAATYLTGAVKQGRFYQVGEDATLPTGVRKISNVIVKKGAPGFATTVTQPGNYEVDEDLGRILILPGSTDIPDDTALQITYDRAASTRTQVISSSESVYGTLRFVSMNPKGIKKDYYFPYVKLSPDGDFNLKGDDWQKMQFNFEALKRGNLEALYIDGRPA